MKMSRKLHALETKSGNAPRPPPSAIFCPRQSARAYSSVISLITSRHGSFICINRTNVPSRRAPRSTDELPTMNERTNAEKLSLRFASSLIFVIVSPRRKSISIFFHGLTHPSTAERIDERFIRLLPRSSSTCTLHHLRVIARYATECFARSASQGVSVK